MGSLWGYDHAWLVAGMTRFRPLGYSGNALIAPQPHSNPNPNPNPSAAVRVGDSANEDRGSQPGRCGNLDAAEWEVVIADGNRPRDQTIAVAVHEDGSILTLSCPTASEYCAPDAFRLEKFSLHGLLLAYTDYTSTKEQHTYDAFRLPRAQHAWSERSGKP